jgi:hypothetical protein
MATGGAVCFATMLLTRLGLGVGEAPFAPVTYLPERQSMGALYGARNGNRRHFSGLQPRAGGFI